MTHPATPPSILSSGDLPFPRYRAYEPRVPVWCVTPNAGRCIHRFFDTSPISPSGRYLAVTRLGFEDRPVQPGHTAQIVLIDLATGDEQVIATTRGWEMQMGANVGWGGDDHALYFNDVVPGEWEPFAVRLDPLTGESRRLAGTIYQASPDGRQLASACMKRMRCTQPGYGVVIPDECVPRNLGLRDDDGLSLTDTETGERRLLVSLRQCVEAAGPEKLRRQPDDFEIYGFHTKWSPRNDRLIFTIRWFPHREPRRWGALHQRIARFAVYTLAPDGSDLQLAVGPEQWQKGGHHINFSPDGRSLSMNLKLHSDVLRFCQVDLDGRDLRPILDTLPGSGHPTLHPDGRHLLTDTYTREATAFGDGTIPLRWVDLTAGTESTLVRINTAQPTDLPEARVDPHPAWDRTWRWITFNGHVDGTRRVFVADFGSLLD